LLLTLTADADTDAMVDVALPAFDWNGQLPPAGRFDRVNNQPGVRWDTTQLYATGSVRLLDVAQLMPGDANRSLMFESSDLVQVLQADKYLTGEPATWGEGDWNGGPGGWWGSPPAGDGVFNQMDIVAALRAGVYLTGPYAAIDVGGTTGQGQTAVASVPEPSAFLLAVLSVFGLIVTRGRSTGFSRNRRDAQSTSTVHARDNAWVEGAVYLADGLTKAAGDREDADRGLMDVSAPQSFEMMFEKIHRQGVTTNKKKTCRRAGRRWGCGMYR
jgi:hypothetical protein